MNMRRVGSIVPILLFAIAALAIGWHILESPGIVRAQQSSSAAAAPAPAAPSQQQQQAAAPTAPAAAAPVPAPAPAQQASPAAPQQTPTAGLQQAQTPPGPAIKAETREVRVDVVVTDKKGNYIQDLTTKDFRLYEDDKEQAINTFSFGAAPNGPIEAQRHYMVVFFDNSSMDLSDQPRARAAAAKFIDAYAGPDRVMAVMNFGGTLQIVQNFTTDTARLKQAVSGIATSNVSPNATAANTSSPTMGLPQSGFASLGNAEGDFGAYTLLLSIRQLAKNLAAIPGRKSLILFTAGFELSAERFSELTATIDACNKANVAIYPMDVRGLVAPTVQLRRGDATHAASAATGAASTHAGFQLAAYHPGAGASLVLAAQHGGGGGGGGTWRWRRRWRHGWWRGRWHGRRRWSWREPVGRAADTAERAAQAADTAGRVVEAREREVPVTMETRTTISRGRLFRNFQRLRRRTSKSCTPWLAARAVSRF